MTKPPVKPLGRKAYGSTPHLPGSRSGPGDWYSPEGQALIATATPRAGDVIAVSEKIDGSCCAAARIDNRVHALIRSGYLATDSHYPQHHVFAAWVEAHQGHFMRLLADGERAVADWLLIAHGTRYHLDGDADLFPIFEIFQPGRDRGLSERRAPHAEMTERVRDAGLVHVPYLHVGGPISVEIATEKLGPLGHHHALERPEGVIYRVEKDGKYDFTVKHVFADKIDGKYIPAFDKSIVARSIPNGPAALRWIARTGIEIDRSRADSDFDEVTTPRSPFDP